MPEFRNVVREHRFPASVRHRGPGRRPQRDRISVSGLTQKPRLLEAPHRRDLCHLHASQTGGQHVAVLTVNHDDNTQTSHRLHDATLCDPPNPCPCSKTHTSIGGRRDRYILLLSVLFETTPAAPPTTGKSPDGETTNADVVFVHGRRCARCLLWSRVSRYAIAASCKSASVDLNS
jgi:hypothetical protein